MAQKQERMEWLDAMRGFTMLMVVAYHVSLVSFGETPKTSAAMSLLVLFRMPLFFFVSGFVAYKASFQWSLGNTAGLLWKKIQIQIVPTVIFLIAYLVIRRGNFETEFIKALESPYKYGYWFTLTLLYMFICYYTLSLLLRRVKCQNVIWIIIWIASIAVYATAYMPKYFTYPKDYFWKTSSLIQLVIYFQFFLCGNLVRRYWTEVQRVFESKWFFPILAILAFVCCADILRWHNLRFMWTNLPRTLAMYSTMIVVLMFFRSYKDSFTKNTILGRSLQYVGTRTLDVYLLHYLFLPRHLEMVGVFFKENPNPVLEFFVSVFLACLVILVCLTVSEVIRLSPFLEHRLFGVKSQKRK